MVYDEVIDTRNVRRHKLIVNEDNMEQGRKPRGSRATLSFFLQNVIVPLLIFLAFNPVFAVLKTIFF